MQPLRVALAALTAGADPAANAAQVRAALAAAQAAGARVLLTPECVLPGYPSAARAGLDDVDWCALAELEEGLAIAAERAGILLVLGSAAQDGDRRRGNEAVVVGGERTVARYRKRCLTPTDRGHFAPGAAPLVVPHAGWRLGIAICYELRFADVFAGYATQDVDALLVIAHMAGPDPDPGTKAALIPQLCAVRAAEWATPLAFCNTAAADRYCDSGAWDARGVRLATRAEGLLVVDLPPRAAHDAWYANLRSEHLARWQAR